MVHYLNRIHVEIYWHEKDGPSWKKAIRWWTNEEIWFLWKLVGFDLLTCCSWSIAPEKDAGWRSTTAFWMLLGFQSLWGWTGPSVQAPLRRLGKLWRSESFHEGILEGLLLWAFKFSQGPWNATILHDPLHWALSQYVEVADTEQAYWVWPDSYLPASPPGPVKLPGAGRSLMETLQILTTLFLIKI